MVGGGGGGGWGGILVNHRGLGFRVISTMFPESGPFSHSCTVMYVHIISGLLYGAYFFFKVSRFPPSPKALFRVRDLKSKVSGL